MNQKSANYFQRDGAEKRQTGDLIQRVKWRKFGGCRQKMRMNNIKQSAISNQQSARE
jgi:hypothetical protein